MSHDSDRDNIINASQDMRSGTSRNAAMCFSKSTNHHDWFCAIQQTALDPQSEVHVMKMDITLFDVLVGRCCFNLDNCLGHHVL